jgi:hypothetical protein
MPHYDDLYDHVIANAVTALREWFESQHISPNDSMDVMLRALAGLTAEFIWHDGQQQAAIEMVQRYLRDEIIRAGNLEAMFKG